MASAWRDLSDVVRSDTADGSRLAEALNQIRRLVPLVAEGVAAASNGSTPPDAGSGRSQPAATPADDLPPPAESEPFAGSFTFLVDAGGVMISVAGAERGALIGASIAVASPAGTPGADADTAAAFARRQPIRAARFLAAGAGAAAGLWRIWARPLFDDLGAFRGYEGAARRPWTAQRGLGQTRVRRLDPTQLPDITRQLVHELRTPINAIRGFAEIIEGEMMGPASGDLRALGSDIAEGAKRLTVMIDDLDLLAALENQTSSADPVDRATNLLPLVQRIVLGLDHERTAVSGPSGLPLLAIDPALAARMLSHLLAATLGYAAPHELIEIAIARDAAASDFICLTVARPRILAGVEPVELLDLATVVGGDWPHAPALGLGFSLRLAGRLAASVGGLLEIEDETFVLNLPTIAADRGHGRG